jgi:hypothetical protein
MEGTEESKAVNGISNHLRSRLGALLIALGLLFLLDLYLQTGWLTLAIMPVVGVLAVWMSIVIRRFGWMITGCILLALGGGLFLFFGPLSHLSPVVRAGAFLLAFGLGWGLMILLSWRYFQRTTWWATVPFGVLVPGGLIFLITPMRLIDFALYLLLGLGLMLLLWGSAARLFGLIIAGSLLLGIGPGMYVAWGVPVESNSLARVGVMLVSFALGWGLITLFSRRVTHKICLVAPHSGRCTGDGGLGVIYRRQSW